jgi:hypothetical protein
VWTSKGYLKLYPNLYVLLIGPSAIGKGIALHAAKDIRRAALGDEKVPTFSQKGTTESLIGFLAELSEKREEARALIFVPEFSTLIGRSKLDPSLVQLLTDYYDCPDITSYHTKSRGLEQLQNVCLNIQAGSVPEWIKSSLPEDVIGGGFTSRIMMVYRTEGGMKNPFGTIDAYTEKCKSACINDLRMISEIQGEFQWSAEAKDYYEDWYNDYLDRERDAGGVYLDGYYGRKKTNLVKIAMCFSASRGNSRVIEEYDLENAYTLMNKNEIQLKRLVIQMAQTEFGRYIDRVRNIIQRKGVITHSALLRSVSNQLQSSELKNIVETLWEAKEIEISQENRKTLYIWLTDELKEKQMRAKLRKKTVGEADIMLNEYED